MNQAGIDLLKEFEGTGPQRDGRYVAYWDDLGKVWTGPFGFTEGVHKGMTWTPEQAEQRLSMELAKYEQAVRLACLQPPNDNEAAAMTCLAWNIGIAGFKRSTVLKAHNRVDSNAAARAFGLWNQAGGKVVRGLTRRRAAESALYLTPIVGESQMPQRVDPESRLLSSGIVRGSTLSAGAAALGTVAETAGSVRTVADEIGIADWLPYLLVVVVLAGAGYAIWLRHKQRKGGWA